MASVISDCEVNSSDDDYYYGEDDSYAGYSTGSDGDDGGCQKTYVVLSEDGIRRRQEADMSKVSDMLSITRGSAFVILRRLKWHTGWLEDECFLDEQGVRDAAGLAGDGAGVIANVEEVTCGICFERYPAGEMSSAGCSHYYCHECWRGYIREAVGNGLRCLSLRCPDPPCSAAVVPEMVDKVAAPEDREKYSWFALRSYVEENKDIKWCPGPSCSHAVEFLGGAAGNYDVACDCKHAFCWNCAEETHRPVDCETVNKWLLKDQSESETTNWLLSHSKPCPKCKRPIEKNEGCMHMTCTEPCKYEFCWLCLFPWKDHENQNVYQCNRYVQEKAAGKLTDEEMARRIAKNSLDRYLHYYERWAANKTSREKAQKDLRRMTDDGLDQMATMTPVPVTALDFVLDAWAQIVECRRLLQWTYAYGYYLEPGRDDGKLVLFEYLQSDAEAVLEWLHDCAEQEAQKFVPPKRYCDDEKTPPAPEFEEFEEFREKLMSLTRVVRKYFGNLVKALEAGLSEVQ